MRRPKKNWTRQLRITLAIYSFVVVGCVHAPEKPVLEVGLLDVPSSEVIVNMTDGSQVKTASDVRYERLVTMIEALGSVRQPILSYDRAIAFRPPEWEKFIDYVHELEAFIQEQFSQMETKIERRPREL